MPATYYRSMAGVQVQQSEATAARRTFAVEFPITNVGSDPDVLTVTVSKGGAAPTATAGSTLTQISGALYKLILHATDLNTIGDLAVIVAGSVDTTVYTGIQVVGHDPYADLLFVKQAQGGGKIEADTADNTIKTYAPDGVTVLNTSTKSVAGTKATWTPS